MRQTTASCAVCVRQYVFNSGGGDDVIVWRFLTAELFTEGMPMQEWSAFTTLVPSVHDID